MSGGWLQEQLARTIRETENWSSTKRDEMLRQVAAPPPQEPAQQQLQPAANSK